MRKTKIRIAVFFFLATFTASAAAQVNTVVEARRLTDFGVDAALKGLWEEAGFRWRQAVRVYPNFPAAHNNLAVLYEHTGKYEAAQAHYHFAAELTKGNRYIESNERMFRQFYSQHVKQLDRKAKRDKGEEAEAPSQEAAVDEPAAEETNTENGEVAQETDDNGRDELIENPLYDPAFDIYHKIGAPSQVLIKHPKRQTAISGKYRRIYIAGFSAIDEGAANLNFETTEYLRSELRKFTLYDIVPLEELSFPQDEDKFYELIDDEEFWRRLGSKVGADLSISGRVRFYAEPADGFYPYEYRSFATGEYRTATMLIQRTAFTIELDLFFHEAATGKLIHEESFGQTIVFRGRLSPTLQAFFDVINRILPRFLDILVPREHDAIRFVLRG